MDPRPYAELQQLVQSGQIDEALAALQARVAGLPDDSWPQAVSLIQARYSALKKKEMMGMIDFTEAEVAHNQVNHALLEVLEALEAGQPSASQLLPALENPPAPAPVAAPPAPVTMNRTDLGEASIEISDSRDVVIGSGVTITRKIFNALGRWQFLAILGAIAVLAGLWYVLRGEIISRQDATFATLGSIRAELARLATSDARVAAWDEQQRRRVDAGIAAGMQALENGRYRDAVRQLDDVAANVELATVHKNLAYAYAQLGDWPNSFRERQIAERIDPTVFPVKSRSELGSQRVDVLDADNGGRMLAASHPGMRRLADHDVSAGGYSPTDWAVYGFVDGRPATIDQVEFYLTESSNMNVQEFELLVGDESPTGPFRAVGRFKPYNGFLTETPFQTFSFPATTAKYVKYQSVAGTWFYEVRVWGTVE